jgi:Ca2+-binding RTX toxin-like protein
LGNNLIFGGNSNDSITTGTGNDTLYGGPASLPIGGAAGVDGDDTLNSGSGNDVLVGGFGNDFLIGGDGDDSLAGGPGADTLFGGNGRDSFYYNNFGEGVATDALTGFPLLTGAGTTPDQIGDFRSGEDKLSFQRSGTSSSFIQLVGLDNGLGQLSSVSFLALEGGAYTGQFGPAGATAGQGFIFYQKSDGRLGYDPDGFGGPNPGVTLAILNDRPNLSSSDITLI